MAPHKCFLILSDVHHAAKDLKRFLKKHRQRFSGLIFAGDGLKSLEGLAVDFPIYAVKGNCDEPALPAPLEMFFELEGLPIWLLHGHRFAVKGDLDLLETKALEKKPRMVIFGHTHAPYRQEKNGIWFFNPGSFAEGFYGILTLHEKDFDLEYEEY